jgi:uncharacterized protein
VEVVLDTNVWVSGFLKPQGNAGKILEAWRLLRFDVVVSPYILLEIEKVLSYPKIKKRLQWDQEKIKSTLSFIAFFSRVIDPQKITIEVESDPKDSPVLAVLIESKASYLISGDADLLNMREQFSILSVSEFLLMFEKSAGYS